MLYDFRLTNVFLLHKSFQFIVHIRQTLFIGGFYIFTYDFQRIAIRNGFIIIIGMQIVSEHLATGTFLF